LKKKGINGKKLSLMIDSNEELRKLGFTKIGHRRLLIQQFKKLINNFTNVKFRKQKKRPFYIEDLKYKFFSSKSKSSNLTNSLDSLIINEEETDQLIIQEIEGCGEKVFQWKSKEVSIWLKALGLSSLVEHFEKNKIYGDILLDVNEETLKDLGITSIGITKKILNSIERIHPEYFQKKAKKEKEEEKKQPMKKEKVETPRSKTKTLFEKLESTNSQTKCLDIKRLARKWDVSLVCEWLSSIGMTQYVSNFSKNQIDGPLLLTLSQEDLSEMGINSIGHKKLLINQICILKN
jgi:hypothetical protein